MTALLFLPGCWISSWFSETEHPPEQKVEGLPDDIPTLLKLADVEIESLTSKEDLKVAVGALEKAEWLLMEQPTTTASTEIHRRLAVACFLISERESDAARKLLWIAKGEEAAEMTRRERPDLVEGYYYLAVLKGRRAEQGGLSGFAQVGKVEELGLKAVELDPSFECGGPYRLLAMLYAKAPPWPTSIGDVDLAIEYAEKAIGVSNYPLNHLIMAEVLIEAEEYAQAKKELRKVLAAPKVGKWAKEGEYWRPYTRKLLTKLK